MNLSMVFLVIGGCLVAVQAVPAPGLLGPVANPYAAMGGFIGFPPSMFFQQYVLGANAQKLLTDPTLDSDLQERVLQELATADAGFSSCDSATGASVLPWLQIRCVTAQLQASKNALKAIENEAKLRALAAASASPDAVGASSA